ncbi:hypothetical protein WJX74_001040 [Apatococcus lobatus]|uniref:AMP-dependent synthetase/ligase domain-containing protein n=1 Tax=Apatococcus lobatus TaxID=904363 RepID=A0AAW1RK43_9CHLO
MSDSAGKHSYNDVNRGANRLANYLIHTGLEAGQVVACLLERSFDSVIAFWAIQKAGGVCVNLDPNNSERVAEAVKLTRPTLVVTTSTAGHQAEHIDRIFLDKEAQNIAEQSDRRPDIQILLQQPSVLAFTSGSSGKPKAVAIPHVGLHDLFLRWSASLRDSLSKGTRLLHAGSLWWVSSVMEMVLAAAAGAVLVIAPQPSGGAMDGADLCHFLARHQISAMIANPTRLQGMLDAAKGMMGTVAGKQTLAGTSLQLIISLGEILPTQLMGRLQQAYPSLRLLNAYGSTESGGSHFLECSQPDGPAPRSGFSLVGKTIPGHTDVYILDSQMQQLAPGEVGDIYVSNSYCSAEYFGDSAASAQKWLPNPFSSKPDRAKMCKTGDRGALRNDGCLDLAGRADRQVKLAGNGFVDLNLIEETMQQAASVTHAFAVSTNSLSLALFVVQKQQDMSQLQRHAAEHLPSWMTNLLTFTLMAQDQIPCLHNGKVDRKELMRRSLGANADAILQVWKADEQDIG